MYVRCVDPSPLPFSLCNVTVGTSKSVGLVLDLHIAHDRFGNSADPNLNGHLHYPNDMDRSLNEDVADKIWKYHSVILITLTIITIKIWKY